MGPQVLVSTLVAGFAVLAHVVSATWLARRSKARALLAMQGATSGLGAAVVLVGALSRWGPADQMLVFTALEVGLSSIGTLYLLFTIQSWSNAGRNLPGVAKLATFGPLFGCAIVLLSLYLGTADLSPVFGLLPGRWPQVALGFIVAVPSTQFVWVYFRGKSPNELFRELPWILTTGGVALTAAGWMLSSSDGSGLLWLGAHAAFILPWAWAADRAQALRLHPDNAGAASVRALREALFLLDIDGRVDYANPAAIELLGTNPKGVFLSSIAEGGVLTAGDCVLRSADGVLLDTVLSIAPISMGVGKVGTAVSAVDVGELKQALKDTQQAVRARQDFLSVMSHEIRTPMNAVVGLSHLLETTDLKDEQRSWVRTVRQSADALSVMLTDILDLSKIESGAVQLERVPWSPKEVLGSTLTLFEAEVRDKAIRLEHNFLDLPGLVEGDPTRVRQVVVNLLSNAVKFTTEGYVCLRAYWDGNVLCIEVEDTGIGIPNDKLNVLFDAFVQADTSTTRRFGGSGLGLAISKSFAEMMEGTLQVKSVLGQGSTFSFCIPVHVLDQEPERSVDIDERVDLAGLRILVVEDNAVNRMVLRAVLSRLGVVPQEREDGLQGLNAVLESPFDVVIMDLQMPEMDGWESMRQMRKQLGKDCPWLISHSANVQPNDMRKALLAGATEHLPKPAPPVALESALRRACLAIRAAAEAKKDPV